MKKLTYVVRLEQKSGFANAPFGVSVRNPSGELNTFFICEDSRPKLQVPAELFRHLRNLQSMYNAAIQWDYESFATLAEPVQADDSGMGLKGNA